MWRRARPPVTIYERLFAHFGGETGCLPIVTHDFPIYDLPNFHLAIQEFVTNPAAKADLVGIVNYHAGYEVKLALLANPRSSQNFDFGPVGYLDVEGPAGNLTCVKEGLYFLQYQSRPLLLLIRISSTSFRSEVSAEVLAQDREIAEQFLAHLVREVQVGRAFRGKTLSAESDCFNNLTVKFHQLPNVTADNIVLPAPVLQRVLRHTVEFSKHSDRLRSLGRHLKRGLLLHGPPGTGKTLCAMYVAGEMPNRTVLLISGGSVHSLDSIFRLGRQLQPATIILEDVDLIGGSRDTQQVDTNALLLKLLDHMDGLSHDADLLFLLTTNRPDVLEPALASRPGRIDQAIEIPLPDADCRRRLLARYCEGLSIEGVDWEQLIEQLDSVSAALIRELVRRAALFAAIEHGANETPITLRANHFREATDELLHGGALARKLLGFAVNQH